VRRAALLPAVALLAVALGACARNRQPGPPDAVPLPLPPPQALGPARMSTYVLRIAFGRGETALQAAVHLQGDKLMLVGVDPLGLRLFTLHYDGATVQTEVAPNAPPGMDPARVISDAMLAYVPLAAWQERLAGTPWEVSEPAPGLRRLRRHGALIAEVHYSDKDPWKARLWVVNFEYRYSLALEPLP
jgi:hypothetical protein